jgi:hypothetical protein
VLQARMMAGCQCRGVGWEMGREMRNKGRKVDKIVQVVTERTFLGTRMAEKRRRGKRTGGAEGLFE